MSRYWAELDDNRTVLRVIVCDDPDWPAANLGGTWVETADPYADTGQEVVYCGPGYGYDPNHPQRFAPIYRQRTRAELDEMTTEERTRSDAEPVFHEGRIRTRSDVDREREPTDPRAR